MPQSLTPPKLENLPYGTILNAGHSTSTIIADFDFETYSPAGGTSMNGLSEIGIYNYTSHPEAEVLSLAYNLKDGRGPQLWIPNKSNELPKDLFTHLAQSKLLEAWNINFEYWVWENICIPKYGFPTLNPRQLRCAAAKARAFALPPSLKNAGDVMNIQRKKDEEGTRLLKLFSLPRKPTKNNPATRISPGERPEDAQKLYAYNLRDIEAEAELSSLIPDLMGDELEFWQVDQEINRAGLYVDVEAINAGIKIVEEAYVKYCKEFKEITGLDSPNQVGKLLEWVNENTQYTSPTKSLSAANIETLLEDPALPNNVKRALEIRQLLGNASVKKLYAMREQMSPDGRLRDLFVYHKARTGRASGAGPQPQNLPNSGPEVNYCINCSNYYCGDIFDICWKCPLPVGIAVREEWNANAANQAIELIKEGELSLLEYYYGDALDVISACLRGMFIAKPGHDFICSDYNAIEAVVLAELAGEKWRQEVFQMHGKIYEMSASKITGIPFSEFIEYKKRTGQHHEARKRVGKVAELAAGYGGGLNSWKQFGADKYFNDDEIKKLVTDWRLANPMIKRLWNELQICAIHAVYNPGQEFKYRQISYVCKQNILYCRLPSGRYLTYHRPRIETELTEWGERQSLSFEGWNTNLKYGKIGWIRMKTWGGRLSENIAQAVSRDILKHAILQLRKIGYAVVLHVHDEICSQVPEGYGSIEEFERIMMQLPSWAANWPIRASGGWRAKRYSK